MDRGVLINNGVRVLQIGLALFYQRKNLQNFVNLIIQDILEDLDVIGKKTFYQVIDITCNRLQFSKSTFWEGTDRGNLNIYYTPDQEEISIFKNRLFKEIQKHS